MTTAVAVLAATALVPTQEAHAARPARVATVTPRPVAQGMGRHLAGAATIEVSVSAGATLVGLRWRGSAAPTIRYARFGAGGHVGGWTALPPNDSGVRIGRRDPSYLSAPIWTEGARSLRFSVGAGVRDLRAIVVDPGTDPPGLDRRLSTARRRTVLAHRDGTVPEPTIITRAEWGADESIRRADPGYARAVGYAIVHHTDTPNTYTPAAAPSVVRSIYLYHVKSNGWNDIGYNALVDRYGVIYEGRYGGLERPVIGAQAQGFNTGSAGVALIGTYQAEAPPPAQLDALESYLAWRLDVAHVNPLAPITVSSGGSNLYPAGRSVAFPRSIIGHRDTGSTDCPGSTAYAMLPAVAQAVDGLGGLRIFSPAATGSLAAGSIRFTAALSRPASWSVTLRTASGATVWAGSGSGASVDATWAPPRPSSTADGLTWEIDAIDPTGGARPAFGTLTQAATVPASVTAPVTVSISGPPGVIAPSSSTPLSIPLAVRATSPGQVTITIESATGVAVRTLPGASVGTTPLTIVWDGLTDAGALASSGVYTAKARLGLAEGAPAEATTPIRFEHGLLSSSLSRSIVSPNGDRRADTTLLRLARSEPTSVVATLIQHGRSLRRLSRTRAGPGAESVPLRLGSFRDGSYLVRIVSTGAGGAVTATLPLEIDRSRPTLTLTRVGQTRGVVSVRFRLSAQATVTLRSGHRAVVVEAVGAGRVVFHTPARALGGVLRLTAQDAAGNRARPLRFRR